MKHANKVMNKAVLKSFLAVDNFLYDKLSYKKFGYVKYFSYL